MNKRHSPEQIVRKLRQADDLLASGASIPELVRGTLRERGDLPPLQKPLRWDESERDQAPQGALKKENARLKQIVAEQALDIRSILKEVSKGNF